jgi:acetolactate synthase-1/2/3 large subunit
MDPMMTQGIRSFKLPTCELISRAENETLIDTPDICIAGDLKVIIDELVPDRNRRGYPVSLIREIHDKVYTHFKRPETATLVVQDIIEITRSILPEDGILFTETGVFVLMFEFLWQVTKTRTFFGSAGRSMGMMIPAILGAKLAKPELPMVGIGGDGSTLMRLGELEVFSRMGISVPLVIVNDRSLGTIKARQKSRGIDKYSLDLNETDFVSIAKAFGLNGVTVRSPEEFERALKKAMVADKTTVIDARVDPQIYQDSFGPTTGDFT